MAATTALQPENRAAQLNQWILTSHAFDGVSILTKPCVIRGPQQAMAAFAGDPLHPNDAGYQAMGNAVDWTQLSKT